MDQLFELKGTNGIIIAYDDRVVISRKTFTGFMAQGGATGDRTYYYQDLASVEFKKASFVSNGYIKLILKGTNDKPAVVSLMGTNMSTFQDQNTVTFRAFDKSIPGKSEELYNLLSVKIKEYKDKANTIQINTVAGSSKMDELKKLGELKDSGIITEEEFQIEKKKILNS